MATKDWKKIQEGELSAVWIKNNYDLQLVVRKYRDEEYWDIFVVEPHEDLLKHIFDKQAKTKSQALSFAKEYMRSH